MFISFISHALASGYTSAMKIKEKRESEENTSESELDEGIIQKPVKSKGTKQTAKKVSERRSQEEKLRNQNFIALEEQKEMIEKSPFELAFETRDSLRNF